MSPTLQAHYHLPGLFEFYDFYRAFLPLYRDHPEYFYSWCDIASVYGAPADCIWGGGRTSSSYESPGSVLSLMEEYGISPRLTFSNSLIREEHLSDKKCNLVCDEFSSSDKVRTGIVISSDVLLDFLRQKYPGFYFISSTTKVITSFSELEQELRRSEFSYVVPDFRLNKRFRELSSLAPSLKDKAELLCNECCPVTCSVRKDCYENVSRRMLGESCLEHVCPNTGALSGYRFSKAMENPSFIGVDDIKNVYLPMGFSNFKIEGRSLGSAVLLEFLLHYLTKPEYHLIVREEIYLDSSLDLF